MNGFGGRGRDGGTSMDTRVFFDNFDRLAQAPNGVAKLRELILQMAVSGKLVPQEPNDEPASVLRDRILAAKERSIRGAKTPNRAVVPEIQPGENPCRLPPNWVWTRLAQVGVISPRNEAPDDREASFVPMALISSRYADPIQTETRPWIEIRRGFTHFAEGDVVMAKITPCFQNAKSAVARGLHNGIGAGTTELHVFRAVADTMCPEYVLIYLKSPRFLADGIGRMTGSAGQKRVPTEYFANNPFPLPPLAEQHRIVAKVDELMRLCDELEGRVERQREARERLSAAALDRLVTAPDPAEFATCWQRICDHFDLLYDAPETLAQLRQTILQLAVQGRLVPQDPRDEPATVLREQIREQRCRLVGQDDGSDCAVLCELLGDQTPYPAPRNWIWVRLGELGVFLGGGTPSKQRPDYWEGDIPWVSPKDMKRPHITDALDHISAAALDDSSAKIIPPGSLLMVVRGMILAHSFPVALAMREVTINQDMKALKLAVPDVREYLLRCCAAMKGRMLQNVERSSHGTCRLPTQAVARFPIPLPPLAEQHRIVAKVDHLMSLCDSLEAKLRQSRADGDRLLAAAVHHLQ
jgi:type I restriction enzyme, S subunit